MTSKFQLVLDFLMLIAAIALINVGMAAFSPVAAQDVYRCGATTTQGKPCEMRVKELGSKCHHHAESGTHNATVGKNGGSAVIHTCGATTSKGTPCKRRVKIAGEKCYSHEN